MKKLLRSIYHRLPWVKARIEMLQLLRSVEGQYSKNCRDNALTQQVEYLRTRGFGAPRSEQETYISQLLNSPRYRSEKHLARFEHQVFSQNGEDGIIAEIFRRIGSKSRTFVEIGVGNGLENNTAYLALQHWQGCWIDGDSAAIQEIRKNLAPLLTRSALRVVESLVSAENIAETLKNAGVSNEVDLLSIDIDRNTYWVWRALRHLRPRLAIIEYNATLPAHLDWKIDYAADEWWDGSFNFGASLKALEVLGTELGYSLVGCDIVGCNAFFVRSDLCGDHFLGPFDAETHYEPARYWLIRTAGHPRSYGPLLT